MIILRAGVSTLLLVAAACSGANVSEADGASSPETTMAPASAPAVMADRDRPAPAQADVALSFEGAFAASVVGTSATCSVRRSGPIPGATWRVSSAEGATPALTLTIIAEASSFNDPSIVVNVTAPERASYTRRRGGAASGITLAEDGSSADIDVQLTNMAGGAPLLVKGSIRCAAPAITN